jgi:cardiolipin synthase (CMP-forming)
MAIVSRWGAVSPARRRSAPSTACVPWPLGLCSWYTSYVRNLTLANQLTILRIVLTPAFVLVVVYDYMGAALRTFLVAGLTDALDGLIARRAGQRTSLGAWLDPMADKLLLVTTFVVLTLPEIPLTNHLPLWLTVLVISRDVVIVGVVAIVNLAIGPRTFRPSIWGKLATATFILTSVVVMLFNWLRQMSVVVEFFVWLSLGLTVVSSADYMVKLRRLINEPHPAG